MDLVPWALLQVGLDTEVFGEVLYEGDTATWPLAELSGEPSAGFSGLVPDPTGQYQMQQRVPVWQNSAPAQWTTSGGTWGTGIDTPTGLSILCQTNPAGTATATSVWTRSAEEGVNLDLWLGAAFSPSSPVTFYVTFAPNLRLALEAGKPIRLQWQSAGVWADAPGGVAEALGECESYLDSAGRRLSVEMLPMTDPAWEAGLPVSAAYSGPPLSQIAVVLNGGDAVLLSPAASCPGGHLALSGTNRHWSALYGLERFAPNGSAALPTQVKAVVLEGTPDVSVQGYLGSDGRVSATVTPGAFANQAQAALTVTTPASGLDGTGFATSSVYLAAVTADWQKIEVAPSPDPDWTPYIPSQTQATAWWDQGTSTARAAATLTFADTTGLFSPGPDGVLPAVRAGRLFVGSLPEGVEPTPDNLTLILTGYIGLTPEQGFRWRKQNGILWMTCTLNDRLIMAEGKACGYQSAADNCCHYWAMERLAGRAGFTSEDINFPHCAKFQPGEYLLSYGTAADPKFQPAPDQRILSAMQEIRADAGDIDPASGLIQPMVLGTTADGLLDYFPLPIGVTQAIAYPGQPLSWYGLEPVQMFSVAPEFGLDGLPLLNEFLDEVETVASLDHIRSEAVFEGLDVNTGGAIVGYTYNDQVTTDPSSAGYIGAVRKPYIQISKRISSLDVADRQANLAQSLLSYPAVTARAGGFVQGEVFILSVITLQDEDTQGTVDPVGYYCTLVDHFIAIGEDGPISGRTRVQGRLLGQAD